MTKKQILNFLKTNKKRFYTNYGITKMAIYGSYAQDKADENSDIDILIHSSKKALDTKLLENELQNHFHKKIDILNEATILLPTIKKMILRNSIYV